MVVLSARRTTCHARRHSICSHIPGNVVKINARIAFSSIRLQSRRQGRFSSKDQQTLDEVVDNPEDKDKDNLPHANDIIGLQPGIVQTDLGMDGSQAPVRIGRRECHDGIEVGLALPRLLEYARWGRQSRRPPVERGLLWLVSTKLLQLLLASSPSPFAFGIGLELEMPIQKTPRFKFDIADAHRTDALLNSYRNLKYLTISVTT
ncbi:carbonic anhydrase [Striga asiatica]|uniref:Carbonic anhydrase n=1 Tax=Striga asiatica TaxID=4170 RepID=A0A5A7PPQ0_STRAF|nr:carbonic anhydrase [Striga asiatica]